jgi:hypothetical protein
MLRVSRKKSMGEAPPPEMLRVSRKKSMGEAQPPSTPSEVRAQAAREERPHRHAPPENRPTSDTGSIRIWDAPK